MDFDAYLVLALPQAEGRHVDAGDRADLLSQPVLPRLEVLVFPAAPHEHLRARGEEAQLLPAGVVAGVLVHIPGGEVLDLLDTPLLRQRDTLAGGVPFRDPEPVPLVALDRVD